MLVAHGIEFDARVQRSARSLARHGYEVTVAARSNGDELPFELDGYRVLPVPIGADRGVPPKAAALRAQLRAARAQLHRDDGKEARKLKAKEARLLERSRASPIRRPRSGRGTSTTRPGGRCS